MAEYKLYCLDGDGRIVRRHEFVAEGDAAAIAVAQQQFPESDCELWSGTRKIAVIPAACSN